MYEIAENLSFDPFTTKPVYLCTGSALVSALVGGQGVVETCAEKHTVVYTTGVLHWFPAVGRIAQLETL